MSDVLQAICTKKRERIEAAKQLRPLSALRERAKSLAPPRGFMHALAAKQQAGEVGLIAEIKKASPSKGIIRPDFHPAEIAQAYRDGGATCLSVLTEEDYFQGHNDYVGQVHLAVDLPILRKDFMLDDYQVTEARSIGADCILLIMAALADEEAAELEYQAMQWGMDVLVEVHDETELERALSCLKSRLIGINNRNLKTLEIDLNQSINLRRYIPEDYVIVCESGIQTHAHIAWVQSHDIHCFLVGESLMLQRNITEATQALIGSDQSDAYRL